MQSLVEAQVAQMLYMLPFPRIRCQEEDTRLNAEVCARVCVCVCVCVNGIWAS